MPREDSTTLFLRAPPSRVACRGLHELPCIEKIADDAETLELALIENIQRKDLTPFEEADGLQRLADHFDYTHDDIARKIGRARSSVTETMSLRNIPDPVRKRCIDRGIVSKGLLLQIARQPNEKKMLDAMQRIAHGGLTRDEARAERREESQLGPRPQPFIFNYEPEGGGYHPCAIPKEPRLARRASCDTARGARGCGTISLRSKRRDSVARNPLSENYFPNFLILHSREGFPFVIRRSRLNSTRNTSRGWRKSAAAIRN